MAFIVVVFYYRHILVLMESVISGHRIMRIRERLADKLEFIFFDPYSERFILLPMFYYLLIVLSEIYGGTS